MDRVEFRITENNSVTQEVILSRNGSGWKVWDGQIHKFDDLQDAVKYYREVVQAAILQVARLP